MAATAPLVWLPVAFDINKYRTNLIIPKTEDRSTPIALETTITIENVKSKQVGQDITPKSSTPITIQSESEVKLEQENSNFDKDDNPHSLSTVIEQKIKKEKKPKKEKTPEDLEDGELSDEEKQSGSEDDSHDNDNTPSNAGYATSEKKCTFFQRGHCVLGSRCRFKHVFDDPMDSKLGNYKLFDAETYRKAQQHANAVKISQRKAAILTSGGNPARSYAVDVRGSTGFSHQHGDPVPDSSDRVRDPYSYYDDAYSSNSATSKRQFHQREASQSSKSSGEFDDYDINKARLPPVDAEFHNKDNWVDPWGREHPKKRAVADGKRVMDNKKLGRHKSRSCSTCSSDAGSYYTSSTSDSDSSSCSTCSGNGKKSKKRKKKMKKKRKKKHHKKGHSSDDEPLASSARRLVPRRKKPANTFGIYRLVTKEIDTDIVDTVRGSETDKLPLPPMVSQRSPGHSESCSTCSSGSSYSDKVGRKRLGAKGRDILDEHIGKEVSGVQLDLLEGMEDMLRDGKLTGATAKERQLQRDRLMQELKKVELQIASKHSNLKKGGK